MRNLLLLGGLTAVAMLGGCAGNNAPMEEPPMAAPAVDPNSPLAAPTFMMMAASSDLLEIESSQLALQMSQNAAVRDFAQMLITDHTQHSNQLMATARAAALNPPAPMLMPQHQQMLDQLRMAPAGTFDEAYRNMQVMAHQQAIELMQNYASGGDVAALRTFAAQSLPVLQTHLARAQSLQLMPPQPEPQYQAPQPGERG